MRVLLAVVSGSVVLLSGCSASAGDKIVDACEQMTMATVVNPKRVQINKTSLTSSALKKEEATQLLELISGGKLTANQAAALGQLYASPGVPPEQHFATINYTDEGGITPIRGNSICHYYADHNSIRLVSASLPKGLTASGPEIMALMSQFGEVKNMDYSGLIR